MTSKWVKTAILDLKKLAASAVVAVLSFVLWCGMHIRMI